MGSSKRGAIHSRPGAESNAAAGCPASRPSARANLRRRAETDEKPSQPRLARVQRRPATALAKDLSRLASPRCSAWPPERRPAHYHWATPTGYDIVTGPFRNHGYGAFGILAACTYADRFFISKASMSCCTPSMVAALRR